MSREQKLGLVCGLSAFLVWGVVPVYFKALQHVPSMNILAHRITFACIWTGLAVFALDSFRVKTKPLRSRWTAAGMDTGERSRLPTDIDA